MKEDENNELEEEITEITNEIFEEKVWPNFKEEIKELSKREIARTMFNMGAILHQQIIDAGIKEAEEKIKSDPEFAKEALESLMEKRKE